MSPEKHKTLLFKDRVCAWAHKLNVEATSIIVRPMRTKWASCSTAGRLTFDASVPDLPNDLQDYVIVHELLHFQVPNHGPLWKSLMRAHIGDFEELDKRLKGKIAS